MLQAVLILYIYSMVEKSATDFAVAACLVVQKELELDKRKKKEEKKSEPVESLSPKAREKELNRQLKDNVKEFLAEEIEGERKKGGQCLYWI